MFEDRNEDQGPGWEQQQVMEDRMRAELDSLVVVHKHGLPKEAERLAGFMGLTKQFKQEIEAHAAHK